MVIPCYFKFIFINSIKDIEYLQLFGIALFHHVGGHLHKSLDL